MKIVKGTEHGAHSSGIKIQKEKNKNEHLLQQSETQTGCLIWAAFVSSNLWASRASMKDL